MAPITNLFSIFACNNSRRGICLIGKGQALDSARAAQLGSTQLDSPRRVKNEQVLGVQIKLGNII